MPTTPPKARAKTFCDRFGLRLPILLAPMAGACPPSLSIAVANAGGLGSCGALLLTPEAIATWAQEVRAHSNGAFQMNLWIPDPPPARDPAHEAALRHHLAQWGPPVPDDAADTPLIDFEAKCDALLAAAPPIVSSVMGLWPATFVTRLKSRGIAWFANVSTVTEALAAQAAGADAVVAQGMEAGGHRGAFDASTAERTMVGTMALIPAVADALRIPVIATGGIADGRGVAAALALGASAAQLGTAFLRAPEAQTNPAWANALAGLRPEQTTLTKAFSGRPGRSVATAYTAAPGPDPAPYPIQRALTAAMRADAARANDLQRMQAWAGQSAALARPEPAAQIVNRIWTEAQNLLA
jgi:nitronate monooxygenase